MPEYITKKGVDDALSEMQVSPELYEALDAEVQALCANARDRALANNRRTVMSRDL
jgi:histone H3/H4